MFINGFEKTAKKKPKKDKETMVQKLLPYAPLAILGGLAAPGLIRSGRVAKIRYDVRKLHQKLKSDPHFAREFASKNTAKRAAGSTN